MNGWMGEAGVDENSKGKKKKKRKHTSVIGVMKNDVLSIFIYL
jgi:hypothetical protein